MNGRIDWSDLFLSASGRISRLPFIVAGAMLLLLLSLYESLMQDKKTLHLITGVPVYLMFVFIGGSVLSKRFHDRGRSGWWSAPVMFALALVWPYPSNFWQLLGAVLLLWAFVELALMPGEQGANRFGPNPQRSLAG